MDAGAVKESRLIAGNCLEVMREWDEGIVDLTVTSPPYDNIRDYKGFAFEFEAIARELCRVTKKGGVVVWVVGDRIDGGRSMTSFRQAIAFQEIGFDVHDVMIYQKRNTPFMRSNAYTNAWEFMFVLSKGKPATFNPLKAPTVRSGDEMMLHNKLSDGVNKKKLGTLNKEKVRTNVWAYAVGLHGTTSDRSAFRHPAMFPERLAEDHILSWSAPGDLVLDPMCGAATTGKMALKHGRRFVGIDISEEYIAIARERLASHNMAPPAPEGDCQRPPTESAIQAGLFTGAIGDSP